MSEIEMASKIRTLESEIAILKEKVDRIESKETPKKPWWQERMGIFADDPAHEEAMRLGREYRNSQRNDSDEG